MKLRHIVAVAALAGCVWFGGQAGPTPLAPVNVAPGTPQLPLPAVATPNAGASQAAVPTGPLLKIDDADPAAAKAVGLETLDIAATLSGPLSQTTITMTFRNNLGRQLEGNLEFPLPEGASVVGYGLDVPAGSGILVPGVAVEKERARQIFESEERRRVDPGVLEQTRGNNYRTRVHPIPAGGTRTISITYVADLTSDGKTATYKLPLDFAGNLKSGKIHVEVIGDHKPGEVRIDGLNALSVQEPGRLVIEKQFAGINLTGTLAITQPLAAEAVYTAVEARPRQPSADNLNQPAITDNYFLVSTVINPVINAEVVRPGTIALLWDTNLSRAATDKTAEIAAVRSLLAQLKNVTVELLTTTDPQPRAFKITGGNSDELVKAIDALTYDGALRIDQLLLAGMADDRSDSQPRTVRADVALFVTNGLVTLGENHFAVFSGSHAPVYTLAADPQADHALLKRLAEETGGIYLNLQRLKPEQAATTILEPRLVAGLSWSQNKPIVDEVYPKGSIPIIAGQRVNFAGRLLVPEATVTLSYGIAGGKMQTQEIALTVPTPTALPAPNAGLVPRFWAQQKAAALGGDEKNGDALLALAKDFNLVTPRTSLLVLETADQYVRYRVVPPKSRPEIYAEFAQRIEHEGLDKTKVQQAKIDHILTLWNQRVAWWNTTFAVPTKDQVAKAAATQAHSGEGIAPGAAPAATPAPGEAWGRVSSGAVGGGGGGGFGGGSGAGGPSPMDATARPSAPALGGALLSTTISDMEIRQEREKFLQGQQSPSATIAIKEWSPNTPYLKALNAARPEAAYATYLAQRKDFLAAPSFYLDCANWFLEHKQPELGIRILTNIAQLRLESAPLLRVAAYRLMQIGRNDLAIDLFEKAKALRPDEPQSWRDLALAVSDDALHRVWVQDKMDMPKYQQQMTDLLTAMDLYNHVIMNQWDRFDEIEVVALMEANGLWDKVQRLPGYEMLSKQHPILNPLDTRLVKNLDCDVRIVMTWDADDTDIDLHVIEPTGQEAFYGYNRTLAGGLVSRDFTQGYGPEEYLIHHAVPGTYKIAANYFGTTQQALQGPVTVQATVITHFGRPDEKRQSLTLRLKEQKETAAVGEVVIGG